MFLNQQKINEEYGAVDNLWGVSNPNKYLVEAIKDLPAGSTVLDLGCGEGRNALYVAKLGFVVTAVDISEIALRKLERAANDLHLSIKTVHSDIATFDFDKKWDMIISTAALHLISRDQQESVITKMKESVNDNGLNLITIFNKDDPGYKEYPELSFTNIEELIEAYKDWKILVAETYTKDETHNAPHTHHIAALVARKSI